MIGEYKDLNADSGIAELPTTLNYNNSVSRKAFDSIFDSDKGVVIRSLENPKGHVKTHNAEFVNLSVDNLIVRNVQKTDETVMFKKHSDILDRFSWDYGSDPKISIDEIDKFAHDSKMIVTVVDKDNPIVVGGKTYETAVSLRDELDSIEMVVNGLVKNLTVKTSSDDIFVDEEQVSSNELNVYGAGSGNGGLLDDFSERLSLIEKKLNLIEQRLDTLL